MLNPARSRPGSFQSHYKKAQAHEDCDRNYRNPGKAQQLLACFGAAALRTLDLLLQTVKHDLTPRRQPGARLDSLASFGLYYAVLTNPVADIGIRCLAKYFRIPAIVHAAVFWKSGHKVIPAIQHRATRKILVALEIEKLFALRPKLPSEPPGFIILRPASAVCDS